MKEGKISDDFGYSRDELLALGIYDLRQLGRDVGVCSPTTLKKEQLVDAILEVIYGEAPKRRIGKGRGRPTRRADKPSKIFLDLIDRAASPKCETTFIYEDDNEYLNSGFTFASMVASPSMSYESEEGEGLLKRGVVAVLAGGEYVVRKYRFVASNTETQINSELVAKYNLKDNDIIEYLEEDNKVVQIVTINGELISAITNCENEEQVEEIEEVFVGDAKIAFGSSSVIFTDSKEQKNETYNKISLGLEKEGIALVKVCFDSLSPFGQDLISDNKVELYQTVIGDEYESIVMVEKAIDYVKLFSTTYKKAVLLIDNLSWLLSVVESYPKSIYGTFIQKLAGLPKNNVDSLAIVCLSTKLSKEQEEFVLGLFERN